MYEVGRESEGSRATFTGDQKGPGGSLDRSAKEVRGI